MFLKQTVWDDVNDDREPQYMHYCDIYLKNMIRGKQENSKIQPHIKSKVNEI